MLPKMVENHHRGEGEIYSIQLLELVFISGKIEARTNPVLYVIAELHKSGSFSLKLEPEAQMDPEKIPGGTCPVTDGRINVCLRT